MLFRDTLGAYIKIIFFIERDYNVYLAADGVSSQRQFDRVTAFEVRTVAIQLLFSLNNVHI